MKFRFIRNQKVITDADLAEALNMQCKIFVSMFKRSKEYFPQDSYFQLTYEEQRDLVKNYCFTHAERLRYAKRLPFVLNKTGIFMMLCILRKNPVARELRKKLFASAAFDSIDLEDLLK